MANFSLKVYYEDTDSGGVVYYANYLKYLERARSEAIYSLGLTNTNLQKDHHSLIIVKSCNIEYKKPARFEDELEIISSISSKTNYLVAGQNMGPSKKEKAEKLQTQIISEEELINLISSQQTLF